jgi:hypothetical protein
MLKSTLCGKLIPIRIQDYPIVHSLGEGKPSGLIGDTQMQDLVILALPLGPLTSL